MSIQVQWNSIKSAVETLSELSGEYDKADEVGFAIDIAIKTMKQFDDRLIPKKPFYQGDDYSGDEVVYGTWVCPCCGKVYELDYDDYKYCPECGQAIDWSEDEHEF